jgi:hypothetical protein
MPYIVVLRYKGKYVFPFFMLMLLWNLFNLMCDLKYLSLWLETYIDIWYWFVELNLYAKHGMFMLIMSALFTLLMWALCNYYNRAGYRWSYFNSTAGWFYKHMFKLLENLRYLCKSVDMVNIKASCPFHPNMVGHLTLCQTHDASVTFNGFIQLLWHHAELCRFCRWQHSTRCKEPTNISRF